MANKTEALFVICMVLLSITLNLPVAEAEFEYITCLKYCLKECLGSGLGNNPYEMKCDSDCAAKDKDGQSLGYHLSAAARAAKKKLTKAVSDQNMGDNLSDVVVGAKEKAKEVVSVLPNLGQALSTSTQLPPEAPPRPLPRREFDCDNSGRCKNRFIDAFGNTIDKPQEAQAEQAKDKAKDLLKKIKQADQGLLLNPESRQPDSIQRSNLLKSLLMVLYNLEPQATNEIFERMKMEKEEGRRAATAATASEKGSMRTLKELSIRRRLTIPGRYRKLSRPRNTY